jgi:hypothetical protein
MDKFKQEHLRHMDTSVLNSHQNDAIQGEEN